MGFYCPIGKGKPCKASLIRIYSESVLMWKTSLQHQSHFTTGPSCRILSVVEAFRVVASGEQNIGAPGHWQHALNTLSDVAHEFAAKIGIHRVTRVGRLPGRLSESLSLSVSTLYIQDDMRCVSRYPDQGIKAALRQAQGGGALGTQFHKDGKGCGTTIP